MKIFRLCIVLLLLLLAPHYTMFAEYLSVFNIDSSRFPIMSGKFYAFDASGLLMTNLSKDDFSVTENGINRNIRVISCPSPKPPTALSAVLVIDCSNSMIETIPNRIGFAKSAAKAWVEGLDLSKSECAIVAFNVKNYFVCDFTDDKAKLLKSIENLYAEKGTNYHSALLDPPAGGLLTAINGKHKRVVIFLSDGLPNFPPNEKAIIDMAHQYNITMYCVTLSMPVPQCMVNFANQTGGKVFPNITTADEAEATYRKILKTSQNLDPCTIEWESTISCIEEERNTVISLKNNNATSAFTYKVPYQTISDLYVVPKSFKFENIPIGTKIDTTVSITAINNTFEVSDIKVNNPLFDISPKAFTITPGQTKTLNLTFTPVDSGYNFCQFDIENNLCNGTIYASGGFKGKKPNTSTIHLVKPNGREKFLVGIDTVISWEGVTPFDTVRLEYSIDQGASWINITDSATALNYRWDRVANTPSTQCYMRVKQRAGSPGSVGGWLWTMDIGTIDTSASEEIKSLGVDANDNIYITGLMADSLILDTDTIPPDQTFKNKFLAKFSPDGKYNWLKYFDASGYFVFGNSMTFDANENIYMSGFNNNLVDIGNSVTFTQVPQNNPGNFLVKFDRNGVAQWAKTPGKHFRTDKPTESEITSDGKQWIFMTGAYGNDIDTLFDFGDGFQMATKGNWDVFVACYAMSNGRCSWVHRGGDVAADVGKSICMTADGDVGITGRYSTGADFGDGQTLSPKNKNTQMFIARYSPQGPIRFARGPDGTGTNYGNKIAGDKQNNLYIAGLASGQLDFGNKISLIVPAGNQMLLTKYNKTGFCLWAISAKSVKNGSSEGLNIKIDDQDNPVVLGSFNGEVDFGNNKKLKAIGNNKNYFVVCYSSDGTCLWAKRLQISVANNTLIDMKMDNLTNLVIAGSFNGKSSFEDPNTIASKGANDIFISKMMSDSRLNLQMDQSDTLWAIVKPILDSKDVNFWKVTTGDVKDSVVNVFVHNRGTYPAQITQMKITGQDAADFDIVSGLPPVNVPALGDINVEFRFKPTKPGNKSAKIEIYTRDTMLIQNIIGEAVFQSLQVAAPLIDFGKIETFTQRDSIVTAVLKNNGTIPVQIKQTYMKGPDTTQFSIINGGGTFTLAPGKSQPMSLRFSPYLSGRTSGSIAFDYVGVGSPAVAELYGEAYELNASIVVESQIDFNNVACQQQALDTITVLNRGFKPLLISSAVFSNPKEFTFTKPFTTTTIDTNQKQSFEIVFKPDSSGTRFSTLTLKNNAGKDSLLTINLFGRKDSVLLASYITNYDLGVLCPNQIVDTIITIKNYGSIRTSGHLTISNSLTSTSSENINLDTAESITLPVQFKGSNNENVINETIIIEDSICGNKNIINFTGVISSPKLSSSNVSISAVVGLPKQEEITLENTSSRDLVISNSPTISDNRFRLIGANFPITIQAKTKKTIKIEYAPTDTMPTGITLNFLADPCNISTTIQINGIASAVGVSLNVASVSANAGEIIEIPITLKNAENINTTGVSGFTADFVFNATMLEPLNEPKGTITDGVRTIPLTLNAPAQKESVVAKLTMMAGLGNDTSSTLSLRNIKPVGGFVAIYSSDGQFKLLDICKEGGNRLFNPNSSIKLFTISPNPTSDNFNIEFELIETGQTQIVITNILGEIVCTVYDKYCDKFGLQTISVEVKSLGTGTYFIQLCTPTETLTQRLALIK